MSMTITYEVGNSLYLNITNRCSNNCSFCVRTKADGVGNAGNLWLDREPTVDEIIQALKERDLTKYQELVFCGYGEPMMRTPDIIEICKKIKTDYQIPIRINTNGQANLIFEQDITPLLQGWVDTVSISLNTGNKDSYQALCRSVYGDAAFDALIEFAVKCKNYVPKVILTVVNVISPEDIKTCRAIADKIGVDFRVRYYLA